MKFCPKKGVPQNNFQNMKPKEHLELFLNAHCALADITHKATWNSPSCMHIYTHVHMDEICVFSLFQWLLCLSYLICSNFGNWVIAFWIISAKLFFQHQRLCDSIAVAQQKVFLTSPLAYLFSVCVCINIHISILLTQSKKFANLFNRNPNNSLKLILKMTPQLDITYVCVTSLPKLLFCNCDSANFLFSAVLIVMWNIAMIVIKAGTHY